MVSGPEGDGGVVVLLRDLVVVIVLVEIFWRRSVECNRRMEKFLEYGGRKRKEGKRTRKEKEKRKKDN